MSTLYEKINSDLKNAMKTKSEAELSVLRMLATAVRNKKIMEYGASGQDLSDDEVIPIIKTEVKKRNESIRLFKEGGRDDLAQNEESELEYLERYLPEQMTVEKVEEVVNEVIKEMGEISQSDFGKVMGQVMTKLKGQADGNVVSAAVKKVLSK